MTRGSDSLKTLQWRRMARFQRTQHSIVEFCRREGVSTPSFYQWRKTLAQQQSTETEEAGDPPPGFTAVRLVGSPGVAVELPGGTQLHIPTADAQALELMLQTLARMDAERAGGASC